MTTTDIESLLKNLTFITSMATVKAINNEITTKEASERTSQEIEKAKQAIVLEINKARIEQDKHSRGDEFLWFMRKLKEYMGNEKSFSYEAFLESMAVQEQKHREYFAEKDRLAALQKEVEL